MLTLDSPSADNGRSIGRFAGILTLRKFPTDPGHWGNWSPAIRPREHRSQSSLKRTPCQICRKCCPRSSVSIARPTRSRRSTPRGQRAKYAPRKLRRQLVRPADRFRQDQDPRLFRRSSTPSSSLRFYRGSRRGGRVTVDLDRNRRGAGIGFECPPHFTPYVAKYGDNGGVRTTT